MCHASMGNHEIHRCKSCDDWWPHKIYQHHFPGHIKNNNLYKNIVGTQLTALSLTDIYIYIYPYLFAPPPFPYGLGTPPWMPWLHMKLSLKHTLKGFAGGQRLRGGVDRWIGTPVKVEKNMCGKGKNLKFLGGNQPKIKRTATCHVMSNHPRGRVV